MTARYDDPVAQPDTCDHGNTPGHCPQCRNEQLGRPNPLLDPERTIIEQRPRGARPDAELPEVIEGELSIRTVGAATEQNETKGDTNEDRVLADRRTNTYGVLDGMGGHAAGEIASAKAAQFIQEQMTRMPKGIRSHGAQVSDYLRSAVVQAHGQLKIMAEADRKLEGMGATASIIHLVEAVDGGSPNEAIIANVGDSRVYRLRGGTLELLTKDQSLVQGLVDNGTLPAHADQIGDPDVDARLAEDQRALVRNRRNVVTSGLGMQGECQVDITRIPVESGDVLFATSDGVHDNLTDREIAAIAQQFASDPARLSAELVRASRERSRDTAHIRHKDDDISAVAVRIEGTRQPAWLPDLEQRTAQWQAMPDAELRRIAATYRQVIADAETGGLLHATSISDVGGLRAEYHRFLTESARELPRIIAEDTKYKRAALTVIDAILAKRTGKPPPMAA